MSFKPPIPGIAMFGKRTFRLLTRMPVPSTSLISALPVTWSSSEIPVPNDRSALNVIDGVVVLLPWLTSASSMSSRRRRPRSLASLPTGMSAVLVVLGDSVAAPLSSRLRLDLAVPSPKAIAPSTSPRSAGRLGAVSRVWRLIEPV
jgi:hypothetical protein